MKFFQDQIGGLTPPIHQNCFGKNVIWQGGGGYPFGGENLPKSIGHIPSIKLPLKNVLIMDFANGLNVVWSYYSSKS